MNQGNFDSWFESLGDRINPILVKETRQSLKSRHFLITFLMLLGASLLASFAHVAISGPGLDYRSEGTSFFLAYFVILAFAVFVVVPFGAYRSLATEQEERTFELIAISKLRPRQIIGGKLLSAMIQMFIYFSAIGPFMTFTLLLKGIDAPSILFVLFFSLMASAAYSMVGLLMATLSQRKGWQVFFAVAIIAGLLGATFFSFPIAYMLVTEPAPIREPAFWMAMATSITIYVTYFIIGFQVAASRLTFEADNRSTSVRASLVVQYLLCLGWITYWWVTERGYHEVLVACSIPVAIHWFVIGSFLIGEKPGLSPRVARQIPQSAWLRGTFSVLFPGPNTGLLFLLVNLTCLVAMVGLGELVTEWFWTSATGAPGVNGSYPTVFVLVLASYVFIYCGVAAMVVRFIRRRRPMPAMAGAALTFLLASVGSAVPNFFALLLPNHQFQVYEVWQITDPIATLVEIYEMPQMMALPFIPVVLAVLVLLGNLRAIAGSVGEIHQARPWSRGQRAVEPPLQSSAFGEVIDSKLPAET